MQSFMADYKGGQYYPNPDTATRYLLPGKLIPVLAESTRGSIWNNHLALPVNKRYLYWDEQGFSQDQPGGPKSRSENMRRHIER